MTRDPRDILRDLAFNTGNREELLEECKAHPAIEQARILSGGWFATTINSRLDPDGTADYIQHLVNGGQPYSTATNGESIVSLLDSLKKDE